MLGKQAKVTALTVLMLAATVGLWQATAASKTTTAPATQPAGPWQETFSDGLVDANGKAVSLDAIKGKLVGIYFSAHWCPPCRAFTPKLVAFRDKNAGQFEVVFVSSDHSQQDKDKYMQEAQMKWPTVPFKSKSGEALKKKFNVRGIPTLVVLSPKGKLVSNTGRREVTAIPDTCLEKWKKVAEEADAEK